MRLAGIIFMLGAVLSAGQVKAEDTFPGPEVPGKQVQDEGDNLDTATLSELTKLRHRVATVEDLAALGIISRMQADEALKRYLAQASDVAGEEVSYERLLALAVQPEDTAEPAGLTALQRFAGLITFTNILWVLGIALGIICFCYLFWHFIVTVIASIPKEVYEVLLGLGGLGLIAGGLWLKPGVAEYVGLTGTLMTTGALAVAYFAHKLEKKETLLFLVASAVAAAAALLHGSSMIGFLAVILIMCTLGFSAAVIPCGYVIGFKDEAALGRATAAGFLMVTAFVLLTIFQKELAPLTVFRTGALFMGSFIGYLGLLIASSRWYDSRTHYALFQVVTITAGVAALVVGSVWGIGELQKIGGTFFVLYLIEKVCEVPVRERVGYATLGLVVSGIIFGVCMLVKTYPAALQPYLLF